MVLFNRIGDAISGNTPESALKWTHNRQFQAKMPKHKHRTISETKHPIKLKLQDKAAKANPTWLTASRHLENRYDVITQY